MKLPGLPCRTRWRIILGTLALPPLLWALALAVMPTERFRARVSERLCRVSGRNVSIGELQVGFLGGVSLCDVRIGSPEFPTDSFLTVQRATVDISLMQLLLGRIEPTLIQVDGVDLRILRRQDGTIELSDLLATGTSTESVGNNGGESSGSEPAGLVVLVRRGRLRLIDEPTSTRLEFQDVEGRATCQGSLSLVEDVKGTLNGGTFRFSGHYRKAEDNPSFSGRLLAERVALRDGMSALGYLVPVFAGSQAKLEGRLSLELTVAGEGADRKTIQNTLFGRGRVELDPILLDHSKLLAEFGRFVELPPRGRVGAVRSTLSIGGGKVLNELLTIDVGRVPVVLTGSTTFDGVVDYRLRGDALAERVPEKARRFLDEIEVDLDALADVRVQGTVDEMVVKIKGQTMPGDRSETAEERKERLREIGRRIRERIQR